MIQGRIHVPATVFLLTLLAGLLAPVVVRAADDPANPGVAADPGVAKVLVKDAETGKPMAGVQVYLHGGETGEVEIRQTTNDAGIATFKGVPDQFLLEATVPGRVAAAIPWMPAPGQTLPAQFELALEKEGTAGGVVVDQDGKPLAGAKVMIRASKKDPVTGQQSGLRFEQTTADDKGHWHFTGVPGKPDGVQLAASHPECLDDYGFFGLQEYKDVPALLAGKAILKLKRGVAIEGLVRDPDGKPVKSATVAYGQDRVASNVLPAERVKDDGTFRLGVPPGVEAVITVKATGYAPELKRVKVDRATAKVTFDLHLPKMLTGKVVDGDGKPVADATLFFDTWRNARTLGNRITTDEGGNFAWDGAPDDEMFVDVLGRGYASGRHMRVKAGDENLLTLRGPTVFKGKVVDAVTGEAVKRFNAKDGIAGPGRQVSWGGAGRTQIKPGPDDGEFEIDFTEPYPEMMVRVEAAGYMPCDSTSIPVNGKPAEFAFKLEKGTPVEGTLIGVDGQPVKGADVYLADGGRQVQIDYGTRILGARDYAHALTDAVGRFKFNPQPQSYTLIAVRPEGPTIVRRAEFEKTHTLTLQKWGRLEGEARVGTRPAVGAEVHASCEVLPQEHERDNSYVIASAQIKVDDTGRFVLDQVYPGAVSVQMSMGSGRGFWSSGEPIKLDVKAGETTHVRLGGTGRPVAGKLGLSPDERLKGAVANGITLLPIWTPVEWSPPVEVMELPRKEARDWQIKWQQSEEGKKVMAAHNAAISRSRSYSGAVNADGTFRLDNVAPGNYRLLIHLEQPDAEGRRSGVYQPPIGEARRDVTVPEIPGGVTDEPLDLGELVPEYAREFTAGDLAPTLQLEGYDGKPMSLADYRGKYLLLVRWDTGCRETLPAPVVGELWEKHKSDPRFAVLGVNSELYVGGGKKYAEARHITWPLARVTGNNNIYGQFPIADGSAAWLIGPDGKIVAAKLQGDAMKAAVEKALQN